MVFGECTIKNCDNGVRWGNTGCASASIDRLLEPHLPINCFASDGYDLPGCSRAGLDRRHVYFRKVRVKFRCGKVSYLLARA